MDSHETIVVKTVDPQLFTKLLFSLITLFFFALHSFSILIVRRGFCRFFKLVTLILVLELLPLRERKGDRDAFLRFLLSVFRDFAYVARDRTTRKHMCHVFRCDIPARTIANTLRDICKRIMIERSLQQNLAKPIDIGKTKRA